MMYVVGSDDYELHRVDENPSTTLSRWKMKVDHLCSKGLFVFYLCFVYVVEVYIMLDGEHSYIYTSLLYSIPLIHAYVIRAYLFLDLYFVYYKRSSH
jgi:hypothetical protein